MQEPPNFGNISSIFDSLSFNPVSSSLVLIENLFQGQWITVPSAKSIEELSSC